MGDTLALCYHAVSDRWPAGFAVPAAQIERQVDRHVREHHGVFQRYEEILVHEASRS